MKQTIAILLLVLFLALSVQSQQLWVTTYYPTWMFRQSSSPVWYAIPPEKMSFRGVTHVIQFGNGNLSTTAPYFLPMIGSDSLEWAFGTSSNGESTRRFYRDSLIVSAHRQGAKVLICIQAAQNGSVLNSITLDAVKTDEFARNVSGYVSRHNYDGVDVNWESSVGNKTQTSLLFTKLRQYLPTGSVITVSPLSGGNSNYDPLVCNTNVNQINPQLYDASDAWNGTLSPAANGNWFLNPLRLGDAPKTNGSNFHGYEDRMSSWVVAGFNKNTLGIGIASFGRIYTGDTLYVAHPAGSGMPARQDVVDYSFMQQVLDPAFGAKVTYDVARNAVFIHGTAPTTLSYHNKIIAIGNKYFYTLQTADVVPAQIEFLKVNGYGGVMVYDMSYDADKNKAFGLTNPIINAIVAAVGSTPPPILTFTLAVSQTSGGTITPNGITVNSGSSQTFTITPNSGYLIANVVADGISLGPLNTYTFSNVTTNHTIGASFTLVPPAPVVGRYVDQIFTSAEVIKTMGKQFAVVTDKYGTHTLWMDIYTPPASDPVAIRPCIVWIHGGNFSGGGRADFSSYCIEFARRGYVTATIDYRLFKAYNAAESTNVAVRAAQVDFETAKDYLKSNAGTYRIDPNFFIVGGWSAGSSTSWRASYDYEYVGRTSPSVRAAIPIDAENIKTTDFKAGDPPWLWIQHDYTKSMGDEFPLPYQRAADSLGIINQFTVIPNTTHTELDQNGPRVPEISIVIAKFLADNVIGTVIIPPPPPVVNVCDTAYNRGVLDGKASVVCPPPVVCLPYPDTTTMKANAYALGRMSVICPPIIICPPFPDTVRIRIDGFSDGMAYQKEIGTADSARGYKIGWNDVLNSIPDVISAPSQMISVPKPPPKP